MTIACENEMPEAVLSEQGLPVFDESFVTKPLTTEEGFAALTQKDSLCYFTTIDTIGNLNHIVEMTNYLPENETVTSLDTIILRRFYDTNFLIAFVKQNSANKSHHVVLLEISETGNILQHRDAIITDESVKHINDVFIDTNNMLSLLALANTPSPVSPPQLLILNYDEAQMNFTKSAFPIDMPDYTFFGMKRISSDTWFSLWIKEEEGENVTFVRYFTLQNGWDEIQQLNGSSYSMIDFMTVNSKNELIVSGRIEKNERPAFCVELYDSNLQSQWSLTDIVSGQTFVLDDVSSARFDYYFSFTENYMGYYYNWNGIYDNSNSASKLAPRMFFVSVSKTGVVKRTVKLMGKYTSIAGAIKATDTAVYLIGSRQSFGILDNIVLMKTFL